MSAVDPPTELHNNAALPPPGAATAEHVENTNEDTAMGECFEGPTIPLLPPSPQFATLEQLFAFLRHWGASEGVAFVKKSCSNVREVNGRPQPTYCRIDCDRGQRRPSQSSGLRRRTTKLINCPFRLRASCRKAMNDNWVYAVIPGHDQHNHGVSDDAVTHHVLRRRTPEQKTLLRSLCAIQYLQIRDIIEVMRQQYPQILLTARDVSNERQRLRGPKSGLESREGIDSSAGGSQPQAELETSRGTLGGRGGRGPSRGGSSGRVNAIVAESTPAINEGVPPTFSSDDFAANQTIDDVSDIP
ncbi:hypothetical protein E4U56_000577 [Claviceps arundinis]|uniref:FAR1 domain-containing protein n=1 Tax=Claviceps arundinis TaxID=1623583 RepID=A0A9P7SP56_9HYPO|nr:hypothetical protein E4U56_000577 [Claviceps arundinis]